MVKQATGKIITAKKSTRRKRKQASIESIIESLKAHTHISPSIKASIAEHAKAVRSAAAAQKKAILTEERLAKGRAAVANAKTALAKTNAKAKLVAHRELATATAAASRGSAAALRKTESLLRTHHKQVETELARFAKSLEKSASVATRKANAPKRRKRRKA